MESYPNIDEFPQFSPMGMFTVTEETVCQMENQVRGGGGPSGMEYYALQQWCMRFGQTSRKLRSTIAKFSQWLAMESPPWAAYRELMARRLVAIGKGEGKGILPIGIGDVLRRLMSKSVLNDIKDEATDACGSLQFCSGLDGGIEGGVHTARQS